MIKIDLRNESEARQCVAALCMLDEGLSTWECDFIDKMSKHQDVYTPKQCDKIFEIYDQKG